MKKIQYRFLVTEKHSLTDFFKAISEAGLPAFDIVDASRSEEILLESNALPAAYRPLIIKGFKIAAVPEPSRTTFYSTVFTVDDYTPGVETKINAKAQEYGYDNIVSACSYANSTVEKFRREGTAFCKWRDLCWEYIFNITDPNISPEEAIANLPEFEPVLAQQ